METLSYWTLGLVMIRMKPSLWKKFINIGLGYVFDDYFFRKYFRIYNIPKTPQPALPQLIGWEMRKEQLIDLNKLPWDDDSQGLQWITGDDNNGYTIYYILDWDLEDMIEIELRNLVNNSLQAKNDYYATTRYGYYETLIVKNQISQGDLQNNNTEISIITCIRYCPYDRLTIGYYLPKFDIWEFNYTEFYYGQSVNGLRWGKGVVKFDNGFELYIDGWPDEHLLKEAKMVHIPPSPINFPEMLSKIMQKYLDWGQKTNYFFKDLE
jgi:hypothetical protein